MMRRTTFRPSALRTTSKLALAGVLACLITPAAPVAAQPAPPPACQPAFAEQVASMSVPASRVHAGQVFALSLGLVRLCDRI